MRIGRHRGRTWVAKFFGTSATYPLARMMKTQKTRTNIGNQVFHHHYDPRLIRLVHLLGLQLNHLRTCKKTHPQRNRDDQRLARVVHILGLQLNHLRTCKKKQRQRKNLQMLSFGEIERRHHLYGSFRLGVIWCIPEKS